MTVQEAVVLEAVRTPFGRHGGSLAGVRPDDLAAHVLEAVLDRGGIDSAEVDEVTLGCANQAGEDNRNVARMALLLAGFPETVPAATVNRLCGSGLDAIAAAARQIALGDSTVHIAGGVESMSRAPLAIAKPDRAYATGHRELFDTTLGWRFVNPAMEALGHTDSLGQTAENLVEQSPRALSREAQDRFALASHRKAAAAQDAGRLAQEIAPVTVRERRGERIVDTDEGPRRDSSTESLARLLPAFVEDGTVTAGNSSPLNDGASAVLLASADYAAAHGLRPLARIRAVATAGVAPRIMGLGPVPAVARLLERTGVRLQDVGLIELNEAFAAQALAVLRAWDVDPEDDRVNVNGGAIALGHPLGASGGRLVTTLVHEMQRRPDVELALATMCIGVGQGIAVMLERV